MIWKISMSALMGGSSRPLSRGPVATSFTNLLLGASQEDGLCLPDPGASQASCYMHHDLYNGPAPDLSAGSGAQQMLPSFYPTLVPMPSRGGSNGGLSPLVDPEWIEEDSIMQRLLGQPSRGGFRSLLSQDESVDAVVPETPVQNPWGMSLASLMSFPRHFEVGESSSRQLKGKRHSEADAEQISPPWCRRRLPLPQGNPGGNSNPEGLPFPYNVYSAIFQEMDLPADPHVRFYMYYLESVKGKGK
ncbi:hypothetical protein Dimus_011914 [Dionaea muscipula]